MWFYAVHGECIVVSTTIARWRVEKGNNDGEWYDTGRKKQNHSRHKVRYSRLET